LGFLQEICEKMFILYHHHVLFSTLKGLYFLKNMYFSIFCYNFDVLLTVRLSITLANVQLDAQTFLIHLLQSSTCICFEQYLAHPQEVKLY
jgi:hypothetical protein